MWSKELQETTREMLASEDFMSIMPLAKNWEGGGIPFGLSLKRQQTQAGKKAGYVRASDLSVPDGGQPWHIWSARASLKLWRAPGQTK